MHHLMVGYCTPQSLGGRLKAGEKVVKIFGDEFMVKARVESIDAYSAHGDYEEMLQYLSCQNPALVKEVFLVHGDTESMTAFSIKLRETGFKEVSIPSQGDSVTI